jgi:phosphoribosylaminoimidazole-succinocarboxamide synthase
MSPPCGTLEEEDISMLEKDQIARVLEAEAVREIDLPFPRVASGKVREIFDTGEHLLLVASDRISAFDVILPEGIPGKGAVLTQISLYWFEQSEDLIRNHLVPDHDAVLADLLEGKEELIARSMLVKKLEPLLVEAVVRGYLSGSGWKDYEKTGTLFGQEVPSGLLESSRLPKFYFTPTTKAHEGHDEPIPLEECVEMLGRENYEKVVETSFRLFELGTAGAEKAGLILADTKFEFGLDETGELFLIDEVMTPDSSRFWPAEQYQPGQSQPSYDKQYVRDYLLGLDWDRTPPAPSLPEDVVKGTALRYRTALEKLIG